MIKRKNVRVGKERRGKPTTKLAVTRQSKAMSATVGNRNGPRLSGKRPLGAKPIIGNDVMDSLEPEKHAIHLPLTLLKLF